MYSQLLVIDTSLCALMVKITDYNNQLITCAGNRHTGIFANNEDADEMSQTATFHQCLHWLFR